VKQRLHPMLILGLGTYLTWTVCDGTYVRYVRPGMAVPLLLAGAALCLLGIPWLATAPGDVQPFGSAGHRYVDNLAVRLSAPGGAQRRRVSVGPHCAADRFRAAHRLGLGARSAAHLLLRS